jgi:hypothetical protein
MPLLRTLFAVASHLVLFIARKVLSFLLPIPFFPAVSGVLANLVGLDPLTFKHPPFALPPALTKLLPTNLVPSFLRPTKPPFKALESGTIELGEKIRTWRQRDIVTGAERKLAEELAELPGLSMLEKGKKTAARPNIQNVEFDGSVPKGDLKPDAPRTEEIEEVRALPHGLSSDAQIQLPPPALETKDSPTQQDEPSDLKDEDFAKLSAEKQVFEQTKKIVSGPVHQLTSLLVSKSSTEQVHTEKLVPQDSILPQIHTFKAPFAFPITRSLPSDSPIKQAKPQVSSPDTHSTTSSVRLSTAVGEVRPE